ncbi:hypothetical protein ABEY43_06475 [Priestia megaterium]
MSFLDIHRKRTNAQGNGYKETVVNASKANMERLFSTSLECKKVVIDGLEQDAIVNKGKTINDKKFLFRPSSTVKVGSFVDLSEERYLIVDVNMDVNEIYPFATSKLCNTSFELEGEITQVLVGNDPRTGRPIYETTESSPIVLDCIAEKTVFRSSTDEAINLPEGQILITIPYIEHKSIAESQKIDLYNDTYQIIDVDDTESINKVGIRKLTAKRVVSTE